jgi:hypothetical protein
MDYNRREFISLASGALSLPAISPVFAGAKKSMYFGVAATAERR